ncbi:hypothetical protein Cgig2_018397 [Carnegiea gigantea]|uniref:F-box domain-containing protein n=1 Tax=Carnegiea gigantea TaxID=171969 RepID=A0A9Q1JKG6_9CARY|nr:hypothetical protein Cgig2_018397 [Carnegiea gigantea]
MIPLDTLLQVLSKLPAKSLMRFKCVSKCWYSLILHPSFIDLCQSQSGKLLVVSPQNFSEYPYKWGRRFYIIDSKKKPKHRVTVHDPCIPFTTNAVTNIVNGLVCFYHDYDEEVCIHIYNLTTHEDLPLPPPPRRSAVKRQCHLGFDPMNDEYKLLLHWWNKSSKRGGGCDVLTIMGRDNAWRPIDISNFPVSIFARDTGIKVVSGSGASNIEDQEKNQEFVKASN